MCAISGSFELETAKQLYDLNSYRGVASSSQAVFTETPRLEICRKVKGRFNEIDWIVVDFQNSHYYLTHSQAPTTEEADSETIHPAVLNNDKYYLWHNGIIKPESIAELNDHLGTHYKWDTKLLAYLILKEGWRALSDVKGAFACVLYDNYINTLYVFRNEISPLFYDKNLNISSTKFEGSKSLKPNIVWRMDLKNKKLKRVSSFKTRENPYYFGEE